jgi:hypothetical protein
VLVDQVATRQLARVGSMAPVLVRPQSHDQLALAQLAPSRSSALRHDARRQLARV